jgi:hypothetical protein
LKVESGIFAQELLAVPYTLAPDGIGPAHRDPDIVSATTGAAIAEINFATLKLDMLDSNYTVRSHSLDGGKTWRNGSVRNSDISRLIRRDMTLVLSDKAIDRATRQPVAEGENRVVFPEIKAAPRAPKLFVNYSSPGSVVAGNWTFSTNNKSFEAIPAAGAEGHMVIEIARETDRRVFGEWGTIPAVGIPVAEVGANPRNGREVQQRITYQIRIAASDEGGVWTAPSPARRINVTGQLRTPNINPNRRTGEVNLRDTMEILLPVEGAAWETATRGRQVVASGTQIRITATDRKAASAIWTAN